MRYRGDVSYPFYSCPTARYTDEYECKRGIIIREKELNETILSILLTQIKLFLDNEKILRIIKSKIRKPLITEDNSILQFDNEIKTLQSEKRKLYELYKNEEINQTSYLHEREKLEEQLKNKTTAREALISQQQSHKDILESTQQLSQIFLKYQSATELTKEMVDNFIESVKVYDVNRIEIKFTFQDEFEKIAKMNTL